MVTNPQFVSAPVGGSSETCPLPLNVLGRKAASCTAMLTYCVRKHLFSPRFGSDLSCPRFLLSSRRRHGSGAGSDPVGVVLQLLQRRFFIPPDPRHAESITRGRTAALGPLGVELRRNLLEQWWTSVVRSRPQVFGISSMYNPEGAESERGSDLQRLQELSKHQLMEKLNQVLQLRRSPRSSLEQGALEQYVPSLELMSRRLPFGLAETGQCSHPEGVGSDPIGCSSEVTEASLVWFCSPRTSSQWLDYWARQRLQWWRKFAAGPSDFSACDMSKEELSEGASRGVKVLYRFPWGMETLETLRSSGDSELLRFHQSRRVKLQCRDGKKMVVPHVLTVRANVDLGMLAVLFNSVQHLQKHDGKQRLQQRTVLKLHPKLAPVKVALDMGRGSTTELRRLCEGLLHELLEEGVAIWPGYMDTTQSSMERLHTKYDEMGVLFTVMVGENTLENGLLLVRHRDTTIRETMHISEIKGFLLKYISAADRS